MKIVKGLFKKANRDNKDPWLSLLDYRNTPTAGMQTSPAQRLMSRRTKTLVPIATYLLYSEVPEGVPDKIQRKRQLAKRYHDRKVKVLPDLDIGQEVRLAPTQRGSPWKTGTCVQKLSDRSFLVETAEEVCRRNRQAIRPFKDAPAAEDANQPAKEDAMQTESAPKPSSYEAAADSPPVRRTSSRNVKRPIRFEGYVS